MKAGAYEFMTKPAVPGLLLQAVADALKLAEKTLDETQEIQTLTTRYDSLTPREKEVFQLAIGGLLNKQIATEMGVSEITAKVHKKTGDGENAGPFPDRSGQGCRPSEYSKNPRAIAARFRLQRGVSAR